MGYDLDGLGMARPKLEHIQAQRNILINWFLISQYKDFEALQEPSTNIYHTYDGKVPDVGFYKVLNNGILVKHPSVIIEIEKNENIEEAQFKTKYYFKKDVQECFIWDYEENIWYKYTNPDFNNFAYNPYSSVLNVNLEALLDLPTMPLQNLNGLPNIPKTYL
jgi:hypothetical protein